MLFGHILICFDIHNIFIFFVLKIAEDKDNENVKEDEELLEEVTAAVENAMDEDGVSLGDVGGIADDNNSKSPPKKKSKSVSFTKCRGLVIYDETTKSYNLPEIHGEFLLSVSKHIANDFHNVNNPRHISLVRSETGFYQSSIF